MTMITVSNVAESWGLDYETIDAALERAQVWRPMCVQEGKPVKTGKLGAFLGVPDTHGEGPGPCPDQDQGMPILRCPSFFDCLRVSDVDGLPEILDRFKAETGMTCNIVKAQKYVPGVVGIAAHSDKCIDMVPGVPIYILRLNKDKGMRSLTFIHKVTGERLEFNLRHGDLLCLPYDVNMSYTHDVPSEEGPDITSECISFVFRQAGTFRLPDGRIYGQGAIHKTYEERIRDPRPPVSIRQDSVVAELVALYKFENETDLRNVNLEALYRPFVEATL